MIRTFALSCLSLLLVACGVAETGAAAAAGGASQVEEARQAEQTEARVQQQLDAAYQQAAHQRKDAEAASQ
jgi:hypothetical protein